MCSTVARRAEAVARLSVRVTVWRVRGESP